jgi:hypothetical protein
MPTYPWKGKCFVNLTQDFVNLFKHLCHCHENEETLRKMYEAAKAIQEEDGDKMQESLVATRNVGTYFKSASVMAPAKAQAYYTWIYWIIIGNVFLLT